MDTIDKTFYKDCKKSYSKLSNEKLIMLALQMLLSDVNGLKPPYQQHSGIIEAMQDELSERVR